MQSENMKFTKATLVVFKAEGVSENVYKSHQRSINKLVCVLQVKGFYRGLMFPLCCNGLLNSIVFGVYGNSFRYIQAMQVTPCAYHVHAYCAYVHLATFVTAVLYICCQFILKDFEYF